MDGSDDLPPPLMRMFINSTDTLQARQINQSMPATWNDKPPLFTVTDDRRRFRRSVEGEDPILLKGMVRQGIPPPLRCAVWLSNIVQTCHPDQEQKLSHEYRTLAKVRVLDHAYDSLWISENAPLLQAKPELAKAKAPTPASWITFGNPNFPEQVEDCPPQGQAAMQRVLAALEFVLGVEYGPMIPCLAMHFLGFMSESYTFTAIREMAHHSAFYWPRSVAEDVAHSRTFLDVLSKLHPTTAATLERLSVGEKLANAIFHDIFTTILPEQYVLRIVDIYTLEGTKSLFRFGVAVAVLFIKDWKGVKVHPTGALDDQEVDINSYSFSDDADDFFPKLREWSHSTSFSFDLLVKKAYGVHGRGVRKRYRFPRRPILARILKLEEEYYCQKKRDEGDDLSSLPVARALPLIVSDDGIREDSPFDKEPTTAKLGEPSWLRVKIAEWLPLSLRMTKMDLIYSTDFHGRTLETLYRRCQKAKHTIMLVEPLSASHGAHAVGMYASQAWKASTKIYGDGECFLFRLASDDDNAQSPSQCWKWKPKERCNLLEEEGQEADNSVNSSNRIALLDQFQVGTREYISMGGNQDGSAGLRLNEDLTRAETSTAAGFENEPLVASGLFEVGLLEVYQLVPLYS